MASKEYEVTPEPKPTKLQAFVKFFYDGERGEFLGRTGGSWGKIGLFYLIYYGILAAFFAIWLAIFLETLDLYRPRFYGEGSILGSTPGMNFRPHVDKDKNLIWFSSGKAFTYKPYVDNIKEFLDQYNQRAASGDFQAGCKDDIQSSDSDKTCFFDYQNDFNIQKDLPDCQVERNFGYKDTKPCIVIFMNRIYGWTPERYEDPEVPAILREFQNATHGPRYDKNSITVLCQGLHATDTEHLGPIQYRPRTGFHMKYYPFKGIPEYLQPLVMIQITNPAKNVLINVVCKSYAKNVAHSIEEQTGLARFELMID